MTQSEVMGLADQINTLGDNIKVTPAQVSDIVTATGFVGVNLVLGAATFGVGTAFTALMSNPILLILAAVAAGGYLIYKNFDKIESKTIE